MADEQKQQEELEKVEVGERMPTDAPLPDNKETREFARKYGQDDLASLRNMVGSNSIVAHRIFDDILTEKFGTETHVAPHAFEPQSPQEKNIVGILDHTGDTPVRIKAGPAADVPPPSTVNE